MKKKTVILLAVLILAAVCLFNSVYTVEENEYGCTVRLSKIISTTDEPGLHFKVPFLDSVKSFPKATMPTTPNPTRSRQREMMKPVSPV